MTAVSLANVMPDFLTVSETLFPRLVKTSTNANRSIALLEVFVKTVSVVTLANVQKVSTTKMASVLMLTSVLQTFVEIGTAETQKVATLANAGSGTNRLSKVRGRIVRVGSFVKM